MPFMMTEMPRRKCPLRAADMEFQNDQMDKPVTITIPDPERTVPAELWICDRCQTACFYAFVNT